MLVEERALSRHVKPANEARSELRGSLHSCIALAKSEASERGGQRAVRPWPKCRARSSRAGLFGAELYPLSRTHQHQPQ